MYNLQNKHIPVTHLLMSHCKYCFFRSTHTLYHILISMFIVIEHPLFCTFKYEQSHTDLCSTQHVFISLRLPLSQIHDKKEARL